MIIYIHVSNSHIINLKIVSYFTKVKWGFSLIILSQHHLVYLGRSLIFQQLSLSLSITYLGRYLSNYNLSNHKLDVL